jgi:hypothetical protein
MLLHLLVIAVRFGTLVLTLHNTLLVFSTCQVVRQHCGSYAFLSGTLPHVSTARSTLVFCEQAFLNSMQQCSWLAVTHH